MILKHIRFIILAFTVLVLFSGCDRPDVAYYSNGQKEYEIPYEDGKVHGLARWWYPDGTPQQFVEYKNGKPDGKFTRWYNHGVKEYEEYYRDGMKNGLSTEWNRTGIKLFERTYRNDTLHGVTREYYENRKLKLEGNYENGKWDGRWIYWDDLGNVIGSGEFEDGSGMIRYWNTSGVLIKQVPVVDNEKHGAETHWDDDGNKVLEVFYEHGSLVGEKEF